MVLYYRDAFHQTPLAPEEINLCCADLGDSGCLAFYGMGFGGRAFPLVLGRIISFIARATQAMLHPNVARLQAYVDDPVMSPMAPPDRASPVFDTAILLWLLLGADLSWEKGTVATETHTWIGIDFHTVGAETIMDITPKFKETLIESLEPLRR